MIPRDPANPAYDFIPRESAASIPPLHASDLVEDPIAVVKYFTPDGSWTWYLVEYDPVERLAFGLVVGMERELGYFSIDELEFARGPMGLPIERDLHFRPTPVSRCR